MLRAAAALAVLVALAVAGCGGGDVGDEAASDGVVAVTAVEQVKAAFEADEGQARLLLLLSPT